MAKNITLFPRSGKNKLATIVKVNFMTILTRIIYTTFLLLNLMNIIIVRAFSKFLEFKQFVIRITFIQKRSYFHVKL